MFAVSFAQSTERTPWILSKMVVADTQDLLSLVSFTMLSKHESSYMSRKVLNQSKTVVVVVSVLNQSCLIHS